MFRPALLPALILAGCLAVLVRPVAARGGGDAWSASDELARAALADLDVALGRLRGLRGRVELRYDAQGEHRRNRRFRFAFEKPFRLALRESAGGMEIHVGAERLWLLRPHAAEAVRVETGWKLSADSSWGRLLSFVDWERWLVGVVWDDVIGDCRVRLSDEGPLRPWGVSFLFRDGSFWRGMLGVGGFELSLRPGDRLPTRLRLIGCDGGTTSTLCTIEITELESNPAFAEGTFRPRIGTGVRVIDGTEALEDMLRREGRRLLFLALGRFGSWLVGPSDAGGGTP